jgi:hypothetical protein
MSEHPSIDPRVAAAEDAAEPRSDGEDDATQAAEDPGRPPETGEPEVF